MLKIIVHVHSKKPLLKPASSILCTPVWFAIILSGNLLCWNSRRDRQWNIFKLRKCAWYWSEHTFMVDYIVVWGDIHIRGGVRTPGVLVSCAVSKYLAFISTLIRCSCVIRCYKSDFHIVSVLQISQFLIISINSYVISSCCVAFLTVSSASYAARGCKRF